MSKLNDKDHPDASAQTLSPVTVENYWRQFRTMEKESAAKRSSGEPGEIAPFSDQDMIDDLLENAGGLKLGTLKTRRSALIYCLKGRSTEHLIEQLRDPEFIDRLAMSSSDGRKNSRRSKRHIPEDDFVKIQNKLLGMRDWGSRAHTFLSATIATGARPIEWINAKWIDRKSRIIRFKTAKSKCVNALNRVTPSNQSFKEGAVSYRDIEIEEGDMLDVVQQMENIYHLLNTADPVFSAENMDDELKSHYFKPYYECCRVAIWRACKSIFDDGRVYSFYDARNSFAANRRALHGHKASAMMGHSTPNTRTASHYANKYAAWSKYKNQSRASDDSPIETQTISVTLNIPSFHK